MLPFPAFDLAEIGAVSICDGFGSSVPFGLLQSDSFTTIFSTGSQKVHDVADTVNAIDRCCVNIERAERELVQPRSRSGPSCLHGRPCSLLASFVVFS